ncbi:hypothetical protein [Streptomyces parvus]|uniref:hypothetical protein n=1 Tax=Streptomyces parvus TaxID=66428 RepID=UPI0021010D4A|nr:hypothetical protein [Streptomyces parvus]MCQ1582590.1 hypothetical protein [Streptomyces parvus]
MSTARRPLGHGPATGMYTSPGGASVRLLPVEQAAAVPVDVDGEHDQEHAVVGGRRALGPGFVRELEPVEGPVQK